MTIDEYSRKYPDYEVQQLKKTKGLTVLKPRITATACSKKEYEELFELRDGILAIGYWFGREITLTEMKDIVAVAEWFTNI